MSEKVRSLNLTSGNLHTLTAATPTMVIPVAGTGTTLIGAPTLISSTFSGSSHAHPLTPTLLSIGGADVTTPHVHHHQQQQQQHHSNAAACSGGSDSESSTADYPALGTITAQLNFQLVPIASDGSAAAAAAGFNELNSIMNTSQISTTSFDSSCMQLSQSPAAPPTSTSSSMTGALVKPTSGGNGKHLAAQSVAGKSCRFPKLEECAHFHYERVQLGPLSVQLVDDKSEQLTNSIASQSIGGDIAQAQNIALSGAGPASLRSFSPNNCWFIIKVFPHRCEPFLVKRSFENMQMFDEMLHRCVYDRKISGLRDLEELEFKSEEDVDYAVAKYLERFSKIASDSLTCGTILTWLQLDNKGRRLPLADGDTQRTINTPAVGAAYGVRRYQAQAPDEISIEVGDMISVIDMPSPAESIWWRGKKSHLQKSHYEVGFFPQSCVATIGDKVPRNFPMPAPLVGQLDVSPTKPVLRKHGKLIAFFRSFILSRPSRRRLKQSGIYRERVFSCDLSEHLLNSGQEIPMVLKSCAEFIENYGIIDGIYRLSGITSNIQRLRRAFDEERVPDLGNPEMKQDIHAVSSLLKMYFRELPNPLCTYQLYDNFVEAIQVKSESQDRLRLMKETVLKLPPPHYRTLKYLSEHLNKISQHHERTGMTDKNLAIVWAPNLLRSPALESGGVAALRGVGVQAVVTEYLIRNCHNIFDALEDSNVRLSFIATAGAAPATTETRMDSLTDCESLLVEQREHDQAITVIERPKSLSAGGAKLISLEEAQERHSKIEGFDIKQSMPISMVSSNAANIGSYIEVGGGPSSLPDKYHTVLSVPRSWQKRKTHSWKSLFMRNQRPVSSGGPHDLKSGASNICNEEESLTHHKEATQVTFAEAEAVIINANKTIGKGLHKQEKPKSIELFETTRDIINKPMDMCVRSNSIDSLRTAGHSRSVSHDSYFDLLQSPQRGHVTTCPSRELSELGINFDREEPEMRIFSESESLVSSPRVGKENIPPSSGLTSRRIMRARPEEFSSQTNSVNPSPKKQPRLNLLLSPSSAAGPKQSWPHATASEVEGNANGCEEHKHHSSDESCCKRYKLEDQLSDIQYIDCGTPEHSNVNPQTLYASVQVHPPPKPPHSKNSSNFNSSERTSTEVVAKAGATGIRYSYPSVQLGAKRKEQDVLNNAEKGRYSYPGSSSMDANHTEQEVETATFAPHTRTVSFGSAQKSPAKAATHFIKPTPEQLRAKNRNSYCNNTDQYNSKLLRSNSVEISNEAKLNESMDRSKFLVTPSSPMQSPRYSLLVGDTSSENSSAVNTPQYDMEPLMIASAMSGMSGLSGVSSNQQHQLLLGIDASSCLGTSHESIGSNITANSNNGVDKRDMHALKRELSLDLQPISTKMSIDQTDNINRAATLPAKQQQQLQHMMPSPNNSNFTDNTSQSVTPSEFGYQHLQRQLSMHSLIETDENSATYEDYENNTPSNLISPLSGVVPKLPSPIKSTISITYNLKSPNKEASSPINTSRNIKPKAILETSFDENTVYEQVKLFRNSVTEVNQLLSENRKSLMGLEHVKEVDEKEIEDPSIAKAAEMSNELLQMTTRDGNLESYFTNATNDEDMLERESLLSNLDDMTSDEKLLYENVELRKPKSVYENLLGENMKSSLLENESEIEKLNDKIELDSLDSVKTVNATDKICEQEHLMINRKSPSNFSVKELATKFECSPVEQLPAFDFTVRGSMRKSQNSIEPKQNDLPLPSPPVIATSNIKQKLNKSQQITRSLDENAFVREFGGKQLHELSARSTQQLPELAEVNNRRKSFDFTRPKTLNPPKRLPGMPITEEICQGRGERASLHYYNNSSSSSSGNNGAQDDFEPISVKITPTTENRISLIQNNVVAVPTTNASASGDVATAASDLNNSNMNVKGVLSGVKLDRERIDKIKEERRQQLTQKYHTETLKSRSKTDLNTASKEDDDKKFHAESMRVKSKSRGDMNSLQKDMENVRQFGRASASYLHAGSESTLSMTPNYGTQRVRSISDEKNQNCDNYANNGTTSVVVKTTNKISNNSNTLTSTTTTTTTTATHNNVKIIPTEAQKKSSSTPEYEEFSARATVQKFERKTMDFANGGTNLGTRERARETESSRGSYSGNGTLLSGSRNSTASTREKISPQFSIRDMTAMFESRSQNQ